MSTGGRTTLLIPVPEAARLLRELTGSEPDPHVTLAFPFLDLADASQEVIAALRERLADVPAFDFALASPVRFGEVVFVAPEPAEPFRDVVRALGAGDPPYVMPVTDIWPHVTVRSSNDLGELDRLEADLARELPIRARATAVELRVAEGAGWRRLAVFALRQP